MGRYQPPSTAAERAAREAARAEALTGLHERLREQVRVLRTSDGWQAWLRMADRLPAYSARNQLLILAQRPDATAVAGYTAWQSLGRQVDKGQRGLQILAPVLRRPRVDAAAGTDATAPLVGTAIIPAAVKGTDVAARAEPTASDEDARPAATVAGFRVA